MYLPAGIHEVHVGPWIPGFAYKVTVKVNASAWVTTTIKDFSLYVVLNAPSPVEAQIDVAYFPLLPLAVAIYMLLMRDEIARKFVVIGVPLYSRFVKPLEYLRNARRRAIYEFIREKGYTWPREVERAFNMAYGEVQWHLALLERAGLIYSFRALKRRFYVDGGLDPETAARKICQEQAGRDPTTNEVEEAKRAALMRRG